MKCRNIFYHIRNNSELTHQVDISFKQANKTKVRGESVSGKLGGTRLVKPVVPILGQCAIPLCEVLSRNSRLNSGVSGPY